jgi:hypothetical protein
MQPEDFPREIPERDIHRGDIDLRVAFTECLDDIIANCGDREITRFLVVSRVREHEPYATFRETAH